MGMSPGSAGAQALPVLKTTLPASWDGGWFGSAAAWDLDGDGTQEIVAARHSVLHAWNSRGELAWRAVAGSDGTLEEVHGSQRQYAGPVAGDLDGDGDGEIAVAYDNKVAVYDHGGKVMPGWPRAFPGPAGQVRSLAAADLDGDGRLEILAAKSGEGPFLMAFRLDGEGVPGWPQGSACEGCDAQGGLNQNIGSADLDGDGRPEIVATLDGPHIAIHHADGRPFAAAPEFSGAGTAVSDVPLFHDLEHARRGSGEEGADKGDFSHSPPAFADVDGDGANEIILYSIRRKSGDTAHHGNCLWVLNADMTRPAGFENPLCSDAPIFTGAYNDLIETAPVPSLADLAGDSRPEIVVPSSDGYVRGYSPDGSELWKYRYDTDGEPWRMASESAIGDLNGDGRPEVVFTVYSVDHFVSTLTILSADGRMQRNPVLDKRGSMAAPTLADADGDGKLDILVNLKDAVGGGQGGIQIWTVASAGNAQPAWPTGRGNHLRTGQSPRASGPVPVLRPAPRMQRRAAGAGLFDVLGIRVERGTKAAARLLFYPFVPAR
jgi:hypothetical protein